jgi:colicin import membrane protein
VAHDGSHGDGGVLRTLVAGAKDIPRNASWLAGKALPHDVPGHSVAQRSAEVLREAMPRRDSVEVRLARAHEGADHAQDAEDRAVEAAERAHELVQRVETVEAEERRRLDEVSRQQAAEVVRQVETARREAEEHIGRVRQEAEAHAARVLQEEQEISAEREEAARAEAERAQQEAHERFAEATERLARARELAEEAAALAQDAAERARQDAERINKAAQQGRRKEAETRTQVATLEKKTKEGPTRVTRTVNRPRRPGNLSTMSKGDLLHLAQERDVPGRSSMTKKQLVSALEKKR